MAAHLAGHEGNIIDWEGGKIGQRKPAQILGHVHIGENLVGKKNLLGCPPCSLACSIYRVARVGQRKKTNGNQRKPTDKAAHLHRVSCGGLAEGGPCGFTIFCTWRSNTSNYRRNKESVQTKEKVYKTKKSTKQRSHTTNSLKVTKLPVNYRAAACEKNKPVKPAR